MHQTHALTVVRAVVIYKKILAIHRLAVSLCPKPISI